VISSSHEASSKGSSENNKNSSSVIITHDHSSEISSGPSSEDKRKDVINCNGNTNSLDSFRKITEEKESEKDTLSTILSNTTLESSVKRSPTAKEELDYLASALDFSVSYTSFPQKNKTDVVTLVKLTTNPPKVCHGSGKNTIESQNDAASRALLLIADTGLENGNCITENNGATKEETNKLPTSKSLLSSDTSSNS
jgi:hypothetical protein